MSTGWNAVEDILRTMQANPTFSLSDLPSYIVANGKNSRDPFEDDLPGTPALTDRVLTAAQTGGCCMITSPPPPGK